MKKTNITYHILYQILLSGELFKICPFLEVFWQFLELVCVTLSKTTTNVGGSTKKHRGRRAGGKELRKEERSQSNQVKEKINFEIESQNVVGF